MAHNESSQAALRIVAMANDHAGYALKALLKPHIENLGFTVTDLGSGNGLESVDYPYYGKKIAEFVAQGNAEFGIAICGSGIGISIAANRVKGARAALCSSGLGAQLSREHNNANILALGARLIGQSQAQECVERFLHTPFAGGRHTARVSQLD